MCFSLQLFIICVMGWPLCRQKMRIPGIGSVDWADLGNVGKRMQNEFVQHQTLLAVIFMLLFVWYKWLLVCFCKWKFWKKKIVVYITSFSWKFSSLFVYFIYSNIMVTFLYPNTSQKIDCIVYSCIFTCIKYFSRSYHQKYYCLLKLVCFFVMRIVKYIQKYFVCQ